MLQTSSESSSKLMKCFFGISAAFILIHILFLFVFPGHVKPLFIFNRTWGFDSLSYYSLAVQIITYAIIAISLIPCVSQFAGNFAHYCVKAVSKIPKQLLFVSIALAIMPLFLLLRCKYGFLGDAFLRVSNIEHGDILAHDLGTMIFLRVVYLAMHAVFHMGARSVLVMLTAMCGSLYVYFALHIALLLGKSSYQKISLFCGFVATPLVQHFFGYIEIMTPLIVLVTAALYSTILYLRGKTSFFVPVLILGAAVFFSVLAILFIPPFIFLIYMQAARNRRAIRSRTFLFGVALAISIAAIAGYHHIAGMASDAVYPVVLKPGLSMTLFSLKRIWEFLNGETLALGIGIAAIPLLLIWAAIKRFRPDLTTVYLMAGTISVGAGLFILNECLGSADWDIYSIIAVFGQPLVIYLFLQMFDNGKTVKAARYGVFIIITFMALHTCLFVIVNATDKSIKRFEYILMNDPASYYVDHPALVCLALSYGINHLDTLDYQIYHHAYIMYPSNERITYNYGCRLYAKGKKDEALVVWRKMFSDFPGSLLPIKPMYDWSCAHNDSEMKYLVLKRMFDISKQKPSEIINAYSKQFLVTGLCEFSNLLVKRKYWQDIIPVGDVLLSIGSTKPAESRSLQAYSFLMLGKYDECLKLCQEIRTKWREYTPVRAIEYTARQLKAKQFHTTLSARK